MQNVDISHGCCIRSGSPARTSTAQLIIHVNDINDHAPVFTETTYTAVLTESAAIGCVNYFMLQLISYFQSQCKYFSVHTKYFRRSFVAAPLALDEDTGVNSNIYYSILEGNSSHL